MSAQNLKNVSVVQDVSRLFLDECSVGAVLEKQKEHKCKALVMDRKSGA